MFSPALRRAEGVGYVAAVGQESGSCPFASAPARPAHERARVGATATAQ